MAFAFALAVAACGDDDDSSATTTTETTTTTEESTTTTEVAATTTQAATGCPDTPVEAGATNMTSAVGDLDGDGASDEPTAYLAGSEWHLHVTLSSGGGADIVVTEPSADVGGVEMLGGVDVNGDGDDELWAKVGAGASVELVGLYDLAGCDLVAATRGGAPAVFPVGGSVLNVAGVRCDDVDDNGALDFVVELSASSTDGVTFEGTAAELAFDAGPPPSLSPIDQQAESFTTDDVRFGDYTRFQCGPIAR